ncbi:ER membrane protein complex subunit 5 isoform X2 [Arvicanthis niloticus]|uniref:ER membrane protein complex subunit 5 isoform X2 n=1 Tax=Arvicanthis niloticus TaxID=61156 RepID=UPI00402B9F77
MAPSLWKGLVGVGLFALAHAAFSAAQHRSYMRLTEKEDESLPIDANKPDKQEHPTMLKQKMRPVGEGEAMGPPKKSYTLDMVPNKSLEASAEAKGEGTIVSQKAQVGMMQDDPGVYAQNCAPNQLTPVAGDAILPSPQDSLPEDSLHRKDGDNDTVAGGSVSSDSSASAAKPPATSSSEARPYVSSLRPNLTNYEIKRALMTEIRRFGRKYGRLFKILEEVQGPLEVRIQFVEFSIKEAARFKRRHLIQYLEKILEKLKSERSLNNDE